MNKVERKYREFKEGKRQKPFEKEAQEGVVNLGNMTSLLKELDYYDKYKSSSEKKLSSQSDIEAMFKKSVSTFESEGGRIPKQDLEKISNYILYFVLKYGYITENIIDAIITNVY